MRLPFEEAGGTCVFSSEWDTHAKVTYAANFDEVPHGDITAIKASNIPSHDVLLAGFPCQPFSRAGLRKGFADKRGKMFFEIMRIVQHHAPKVILLENVKGFIDHDSGKTFQTAKRCLEELNYTVYYKVLNACEFGLPQSRERVYIIAVNNEKLPHNKFVFPTPPYTRTTVGMLLEKRVAARYTLSDTTWERLQKRKLLQATRGNGFGYRLYTHASPYTNTLLASYAKGNGDILIAQKNKNPRLLTPREVARLQGFPEHFLIPVSDHQAYKQFGNAVAVLLHGQLQVR